MPHTNPPNIQLLGPQAPQPNLASALKRIGTEPALCAITAGWQEREGELDDLSAHVGRPVTDLALYERTEQAFAADPALFEAHRNRQNTLREMQRLHRTRLGFALEAAKELLLQRGDKRLLERERRSAINVLRTLDRHHARRIKHEHATFAKSWSADARPGLRKTREALAQQILASGAVLIAGGHVSVLINRLRLMGLGEVLAQRPLIAWSAGAMSLSERIVLFHDSPPQGPGDAEVIDLGLGLVRGVVALPHATARLRLSDRTRVSLFARRFAPAVCLTLDGGAHLAGDGERWTAVRGVRRLTGRGGLSDSIQTSTDAATGTQDDDIAGATT